MVCNKVKGRRRRDFFECMDLRARPKPNLIENRDPSMCR
jgi:hypothetical protein